MEHNLLVWFCNKNENDPGSTIPEMAFDLTSSSNQLSTGFWFEGEMIDSMSIAQPMLENVEKTITLRVKNPLNFMADFSTMITGDGVSAPKNPMGTEVISTWGDIVVTDGEFIVFKGTKTQFAAMTDADRTKALLGIFFVEKVDYDQFAQNYTITGRDAMALARRWAIWSKPMRFPPTTTKFGTELYVGQIIHFLFHWMGCWHYHADGNAHQSTINKGTWPTYRDITIDDFPSAADTYSTNMSFTAKTTDAYGGSWADEQIAENKMIGDIWNTFTQFTGYKIYVTDEIASGQPRPVFRFEPPAYKLWNDSNPVVDNTLGLFGSYTVDGTSHDVTTLDTLFYPPSTTHRNPITITGITHSQNADAVRYGIKVSVQGRTVEVADNDFIGVQRMRAGKDRVGVVVEKTIEPKYCASIAEAILFQIREQYSSITVNWSDAIKFLPRIYHFAIDERKNGINIQIKGGASGMLQCTKNEIQWDGTRYTTATSFAPFEMLTLPRDLIAPTLGGYAGDGEAFLSWVPFEDMTGTTYTYEIEQKD